MTLEKVPDSADLRSAVLSVLGETVRQSRAYLRVDRFATSVAQKLVELRVASPLRTERLTTGSPVEYELSSEDFMRVVDVIWELVSEGVLAPWMSSQRRDGDLFHVTQWGKGVLSDVADAAIPYDGVRYLERLRASCGGQLDPIISTYVTEALGSFNRSACYRASTVMLGVASERMLLMVAERFAQSLSSPREKERFKKVIEGAMIMRTFVELSKRLMPKLPSELKERYDSMIRPSFNIIRLYRNESGHPKSTTVTRDECYANLLLFPHYVKAAYELMDWLAKSPHGGTCQQS